MINVLIDVQIKEDSLELTNRRAVWDTRAKYGFYYHGTQESKLNSILKEGLKPSYLTGESNYEISEKDAVYLTQNPKEAEMWAILNRAFKNTRNMTEKEKAFVILVPKSRVDRNKLKKDKNFCQDDSFEYHGIIKPPFSFREVSGSGESI